MPVTLTARSCFCYLCRHLRSSAFIAGCCYRPLPGQVPHACGQERTRIPYPFPPCPALPPQRMRKIWRCHFTRTGTGVPVVGLNFFFFNQTAWLIQLEDTVRQVVLNGSYCGSLKCEPTENDRETYCTHRHRLPTSETRLCLRRGKDTIQREDRVVTMNIALGGWQ